VVRAAAAAVAAAKAVVVTAAAASVKAAAALAVVAKAAARVEAGRAEAAQKEVPVERVGSVVTEGRQTAQPAHHMAARVTCARVTWARHVVRFRGAIPTVSAHIAAQAVRQHAVRIVGFGAPRGARALHETPRAAGTQIVGAVVDGELRVAEGGAARGVGAGGHLPRWERAFARHLRTGKSRVRPASHK
jgi:hypothetical protein